MMADIRLLAACLMVAEQNSVPLIYVFVAIVIILYH